MVAIVAKCRSYFQHALYVISCTPIVLYLLYTLEMMSSYNHAVTCSQCSSGTTWNDILHYNISIRTAARCPAIICKFTVLHTCISLITQHNAMMMVVAALCTICTEHDVASSSSGVQRIDCITKTDDMMRDATPPSYSSLLRSSFPSSSSSCCAPPLLFFSYSSLHPWNQLIMQHLRSQDM